MKSFIERVQMRFKSLYLKNIDLIVKNRKQLKNANESEIKRYFDFR